KIDREGYRNVAAAFKDIEDGWNAVGRFMEKYWLTDLYRNLQNKERRANRLGTGTPADAATAAHGNGRQAVAVVFGHPSQPGDTLRNQDPATTASSRYQPNKYQGFQAVVVGQGDTLQSLAASQMGDPNEWPVIAVVNQLKAPYITDGAKLPGTLSPGDAIMIPVSGVVSKPDTFTTGDPAHGANQAVNVLGVDFEREPLPTGQFGWRINTAGGSVDVLKVRGVDNLAQGLDGRLHTTQGENILYPQFGLPRGVGGRSLESEEEVSSRFQIRQQLLADARVEQVVSLRFTPIEDRLEIEADVQPVGLTSVRTIAKTLT
ncbi:MAG: LysM peptidoglycan-binding domain-containing protein, partial [Lysobacterales bacterium]